MLHNGFSFFILIIFFVFACSHALFWSLSIFVYNLEVKCIGGVLVGGAFQKSDQNKAKETSHLIRKKKEILIGYLYVLEI